MITTTEPVCRLDDLLPERPVAALIDQVSSPGGTTVEGLLALQQGGFEPAVHGAVQAVLDKDKRM